MTKPCVSDFSLIDACNNSSHPLSYHSSIVEGHNKDDDPEDWVCILSLVGEFTLRIDLRRAVRLTMSGFKLACVT